MKVSFDFLSSPLEIKADKINVLILENKVLFRNVLLSFLNGCPPEDKIVFSVDYVPLKFKGNIFVVDNIFCMDFSASFIKKLYEDLSAFCVDDLYSETVNLKESILGFMETVMCNFDYDFVCKDEVELSDLFKMMGLKPELMNGSMIERLLEYILLIQKYIPQKVFVLFNLHLFFSNGELESFYLEILKRGIKILDIEGFSFEKNQSERITTVDVDFCEIIEFE